MSTPIPSYRKMAGSGFSWRGRGRLWQAEDHLLEASSILIIEQYRRYFFREVRALVVQRTHARAIWGWVLGGIGTALGVVAGLASWIGVSHASEDWHLGMFFLAVPFGIAAVLFLTLFAINLALGPSCCCHLLTSTGWHALSAPKRLGAAQRAQAQIAALIEAVQGPAPTREAPTP